MKTIRQILGLNQTKGEVGLEIEVEGDKLLNYPPSPWKAEHDGSLRGESLEYVLTAPIIRAHVRPALKNLEMGLADNNATIYDTGRCGVHVHVNCQGMTEEEVYCFMVLYFVCEPLLVRWCGADRMNNLFCLQAGDAEGLIYDLLRNVRSGGLKSGVLRDSDIRYSALNTQALFKFGSLEFRSMRTPIDGFADIATWVEMLLKLKDFASDFQHRREIIEGISGVGVERFMYKVFGSLADLLTYNDMEEDVYDAMRRIQYFAYATQAQPVNADAEVVPLDEEEEVPFPGYAEILERMKIDEIRARGKRINPEVRYPEPFPIMENDN